MSREPKRKLHRKKVNKGMFYHYKGLMLWKYHSYQYNKNSNEIMMLYYRGHEAYFTNWKDAKKFLRSYAHSKERTEYELNNEMRF